MTPRLLPDGALFLPNALVRRIGGGSLARGHAWLDHLIETIRATRAAAALLRTHRQDGGALSPLAAIAPLPVSQPAAPLSLMTNYDRPLSQASTEQLQELRVRGQHTPGGSFLTSMADRALAQRQVGMGAAGGLGQQAAPGSDAAAPAVTA